MTIEINRANLGRKFDSFSYSLKFVSDYSKDKIAKAMYTVSTLLEGGALSSTEQYTAITLMAGFAPTRLNIDIVRYFIEGGLEAPKLACSSKSDILFYDSVILQDEVVTNILECMQWTYNNMYVSRRKSSKLFDDVLFSFVCQKLGYSSGPENRAIVEIVANVYSSLFTFFDDTEGN